MSKETNSILIDDSDDDSDDEDKRTIFCANLSEEVTEDLLYELFLQAGPVEQVRIPREPDSKRQKTFGFITYVHKCTVPYALKLYDGIKLYKRTLTIRSRNPNNNNNKRNSSTPNNNDRYNKNFEHNFNIQSSSSSGSFNQYRDNILNVNRLNKQFLENLNTNPYGGGLPLDINSFKINNSANNHLFKQNISNDDRLSRHSRSSSSSSRHNRHNDKPYKRPENYNRNNRDRHYNNRQDRNSHQRSRR